MRYNPTPGGAPADAPCVDLNGGYSENPIVSRRPDDSSKFQVVMDNLADEGAGFAYGCSDDGLHWEATSLVKVPTGTRTPFGLLPLTPSEVEQWTEAILAYGVISNVSATNTSLQWAFYTVNQGPWEVFFASIVQLAW